MNMFKNYMGKALIRSDIRSWIIRLFFFLMSFVILSLYNKFKIQHSKNQSIKEQSVNFNYNTVKTCLSNFNVVFYPSDYKSKQLQD